MSSRPKIDHLNNLRKNFINRTRQSMFGYEQKIVVFVTGVPRSGTNMVMDILARSQQTEVFFEGDPRVFASFEHISDDRLQHYAQNSPAPRPVFKSLLDSHRQRVLLDKFSNSVVVWLYRNVDDVVRSNLARWPGVRNRIDEIVTEPQYYDWRGAGLTTTTRETIRNVYTPDLPDESANALFWLLRNQLLFDQGLHLDPRTILINYGTMATKPELTINRICQHVQIPKTPKLTDFVHPRSVNGTPLAQITPEIRELCDKMMNRLNQV